MKLPRQWVSIRRAFEIVGQEAKLEGGDFSPGDPRRPLLLRALESGEVSAVYGERGLFEHRLQPAEAASLYFTLYPQRGTIKLGEVPGIEFACKMHETQLRKFLRRHNPRVAPPATTSSQVEECRAWLDAEVERQETPKRSKLEPFASKEFGVGRDKFTILWRESLERHGKLHFLKGGRRLEPAPPKPPTG